MKNTDELKIRIGSSPDAIVINTVGANVRDGNWHHIAKEAYESDPAPVGFTCLNFE